jgi:hypothetical protein
MNKTRKRAIQKHRAKAIKFEARRKAEGDSGAGRTKAAAPSPTTSRTSRQSRRQEPTEEGGE